MVRRSGAPTLTADVHRALRVAILTGRYRPGQKLSPAALSQELQASTGVVREALTRLISERLVSGEQNRGFRVQPISLGDLEELSELRLLLESRALEKSIAAGTVRWESEILAAHYRLTSAPSPGAELDASGLDSFMMAHKEFHMSLLSGCGNGLLRTTCASMWDAGELYRRWTVARDPHDWVQEHADLLESCLARDAAKAVGVLERHIRGTVRVISDLVHEPTRPPLDS